MDIYYEILYNLEISDSKDKEDDDQFSIINSALIDLDMDHSTDINVPVVSVTIHNVSLQSHQFYEVCSELN